MLPSVFKPCLLLGGGGGPATGFITAAFCQSVVECRVGSVLGATPSVSYHSVPQPEVRVTRPLGASCCCNL